VQRSRTDDHSQRRESSPGGELPAKTLLQQELLKRGVLYNGTHLLSYAHRDEDIAQAVQAYGETLTILAAALPDHLGEYLDAQPVRARLQVPLRGSSSVRRRTPATRSASARRIAGKIGSESACSQYACASGSPSML
jgi:hypothetical protein